MTAGGIARDGRRVSVRLTRDAQRQVRGGHPWVFDASVTGTSHDGAPGDLAVLFDDKRRFLAIGLWDPASPIRIRVLHRGRPRPIDGAFWHEQLSAAFARRAGLADLAARGVTTAYRCVHGENDGLPGLVIDRYDRTWVVRLDTAAWSPHLPAVLDALRAQVTALPGDGEAWQGVVLRSGRQARAALAAAGLADGGMLAGDRPEGPVEFRENGLLFGADVVRGQKTGHFLDQRHNRARVGALAGGARVLDVFSCTGGFTVHAAAGGAAAVHSVDASPHAVAEVAANLRRNHERPAVATCGATAAVGDAFEVLADLGAAGARYDLVVVDPPSFASKQADMARAVGAYRRLTTLALPLLEPGGVLVQSSCSSRVPAEDLFDAVHQAAA
ncbi:MAG: class I SAM-dependent rRNA methyltransferase, partial [Acidimicrobiia bacterium]|nr:class I SAM-dependent rRNA methyltransferase [Acidimicrobiia bacterium]